MIQSMTGFGKAVVELPHKKITVEIKSLNSKQLDLSTRIPQQYREMEMEIRSEIAKRLERGKVDFFVYSEAIGKETSAQINIPVLEGYFQQVKEASIKLGIAMPDDWFSILLRHEFRKSGNRRSRTQRFEKSSRPSHLSIGRVQNSGRSHVATPF